MLRSWNRIVHQKENTVIQSVSFSAKIVKHQINTVESGLKRMKDADDRESSEVTTADFSSSFSTVKHKAL